MARHTERPATPADDDLLGELAADHLTRLTGRGQSPRKAEDAPVETPPTHQPANVPAPSDEADKTQIDAQPQATPEDGSYVEEASHPSADVEEAAEDTQAAIADDPLPGEEAVENEPDATVEVPCEPEDSFVVVDETPTDAQEQQQTPSGIAEDTPESEMTNEVSAVEPPAATSEATGEQYAAEQADDETASSPAPTDTDNWPAALDESSIPDTLQDEPTLPAEPPSLPTSAPSAAETATPEAQETPADSQAEPQDTAPPTAPVEMSTRLRDTDEQPEEFDVPPTASGMEGIESRIMDSPTMASGVGYLTDETDDATPPETPPPPPPPAPKEIGAEQIAPEEVDRAGSSKAKHVDSGAFSVRIVGDGPSLDGEDDDEHDVNLGAEPTNVILPEGSSDLYTVRIGPEEDSPEWPDMSSSPLNQLAMEDAPEQAPPQEGEDSDSSVAHRIAELISNIARQKSGKSEEEQAENLASEALAEETQAPAHDESSVAEELAREMADETQQEPQAAAETPAMPPPPPPTVQVEAEEDDEDDDEIVLEGMPAPPPPDEEDDGSPKGERRDARTTSMNGDVVNMADLGDRKARRVKARPRKDARQRRKDKDRPVAEDVLDDQLAQQDDIAAKPGSRREKRKTARSRQAAPNRSLAKRAVMISPQPQKKDSYFRNWAVQGGIVLAGLLITILLIYYLLPLL